MARHIHGPFPNFDESTLVYANDDCEFPNDATSNWYTDDLFDQLACLQKLPTQSVQSYVSEAQSILYALNNAGESLSESEFTNFLVEGLDEYLFKRVHFYYYLMHPSFNSLCTLLLGHEVMPQQSIPNSKVDEPITVVETSKVHNYDVTNLELLSSFVDTTPSSIINVKISSPNTPFDEISYLAVPKSCTLLKSQLLDFFYSCLRGSSHSHSNILDNSFLICPSSLFPMKPETIPLGPESFFIHNDLYNIGTRVYGVLYSIDVEHGWQGSYLLQVCVQPKAHYLWLAIVAMHDMLFFNMALRLLVLSIVGGFVILLILHLRRCSFKCKQKLQYLTFCLRGRIREIR